MEQTETLIIGAGISGLSTAARISGDFLVLEADPEMGGYCKTIRRDGFVWDYSGHFFHFRHASIGDWFRQRMAHQRVAEVHKRSFIQSGPTRIDFPFQKNIHQLPRPQFLRCLHDLYFAEQRAAQGDAFAADNFREMLYGRYGIGISELFLIPYNEKLYACDLASLDRDAMGRFFPHVAFTDVMRNMLEADNRSYNSVFTYPEGGAIEYVHALAGEVDPRRILLAEPLLSIDPRAHIAKTSRREVRYQRLISTMPFNRLLQAADIESDPKLWSWNQVLVFNLGFDRKGESDVHWIYFPDPAVTFYRVGFYDNILGGERLSLYVEVGLSRADQPDVDAYKRRVLADLRTAGIVDDHRLVASHHVLMDPAYVHITKASLAAHAMLSEQLATQDIYSIGRYGSWTYCSIEDNVVQAWDLCDRLNG